MSIPELHSTQEIVDIAFRRARKAADKKGIPDHLPGKEKLKRDTNTRVNVATRVIDTKLGRVIDEFPDLSGFSSFYEAYADCFFDRDRAKQALGRYQWAKQEVNALRKKTLKGLGSKSYGEIKSAVSHFYGRAAGIVESLEDATDTLRPVRRAINRFPNIEENGFVVTLAGLPNTGKSSLLKELTGSNAEIAAYSFTTKHINTGNWRGIQFVDTPGVLHREEKRNDIESMAYAAVKYVSDLVIYIVMPSRDGEEQWDFIRDTLRGRRPVGIYVRGEADVPSEVAEEPQVERVVRSVEEVREFILDRRRARR